MKEYLDVLKTVSLFFGIEEPDLMGLLSCLCAKVMRFEKDEIIFLSGGQIKSFGIVLCGYVQVIREDFYGNRHIIANIGAGESFGESFACADEKSLTVSVVAAAQSDILFIDCGRLSSPCGKACAFHGRLIHNMLNIVAQKNIALTQKIEHISQRTTREKLLAYLSSQAQKAQSNRFAIPFDRQELADYLSVDRSAMSAELSKLRLEGVLNYDKNKFELLL